MPATAAAARSRTAAILVGPCNPKIFLARQTRAQKKNAEHKFLHDRTVLSAPVQAVALLLEVVQDARDIGLPVSGPQHVFVDAFSPAMALSKTNLDSHCLAPTADAADRQI